MGRGSGFGRLAGFALALSAAAMPAQAQVSVFGGQMTNLCTAAAKATAHRPDGVHICTIAIEHEAAMGRDLAGLYVNRGVLQLKDGAFRIARRDFDTAISIMPNLGEAWVDRGASRIAVKSWREGVDDIDRGLALSPTEPEKAYYNRGLAREHLDDVRGAYLDYSRAAELAPAWPAPQEELKRFTVKPSR